MNCPACNRPLAVNLDVGTPDACPNCGEDLSTAGAAARAAARKAELDKAVRNDGEKDG